MHYFLPLLVGVAAPFAAAHTTFTTVYIDDLTQGDGTCVRMNMNGANSSSPVPSLASNDMACGTSNISIWLRIYITSNCRPVPLPYLVPRFEVKG